MKETINDNVIEISFAKFMWAIEGLPDPYKWKHDIEKRILRNGVDDTTNYYCSSWGIDWGFKLRNTSEYGVEWRTINKILITNSDDESFRKEYLVTASHEDGTIFSKEEVAEVNARIDDYNKEHNLV